MFFRHRRMYKMLCIVFLFAFAYKLTTMTSSTSAALEEHNARENPILEPASYYDAEDTVFKPKTDNPEFRLNIEMSDVQPTKPVFPKTEILNIRPRTEIPSVRPKTEIPSVRPKTEIPKVRLKTEIANVLPTIEIPQAKTTDLDPVERKCPMYQEFRRVNFTQSTIRRKLCRNAEAYKLYTDGYPICLLQNPFDKGLLNVAREGSEVVQLRSAQREMLSIYVYSGNDFISSIIRVHQAWEPQLVHWTLRFTLKLSDVTFLDMGSNIGVYSLQAAKLGLPVVALDANIRNLLRLRLSLSAASLDATLVWNFITADQSLKYLSFLADCNVGGAGRDKADLPDTIPVMPLRGERICNLIKTKNVVMKIDIQGGETDFLLTSGRLFTDFNVAAVQMEWYPPMIIGNDSEVIRTFFSSRGYKAFQMPDFKPLDPGDKSNWQIFMDVFWVRSKYLHLLRFPGSEKLV